jgi:hypothetical protein
LSDRNDKTRKTTPAAVRVAVATPHHKIAKGQRLDVMLLSVGVCFSVERERLRELYSVLHVLKISSGCIGFCLPITVRDRNPFIQMSDS